MSHLALELCQNLKSKGLSLANNANVALTCAFNGPVVIGDGCCFAQSTIDCYSRLNNKVSCLNAQIGRYCNICDDAVIGQIKLPTDVFSPSIAFHGNVFEFSGTQPHKVPALFKQIPNFEVNNVDQHFSHAIIGSDVYIGPDSMIIDDVHIGHGAVIKPHARIYDDVSPYAIISDDGVQVGSRFKDEEISDLLELQWWQYDIPHMLKAGFKVPLDSASQLISFFKNTDAQQFILAPNQWYSFTVSNATYVEKLEVTSLDGQPQLPTI